MRRILLTGCGGAASVGVARSLKRSTYLFGVDTDKYRILRSECKRNQVIPVLEGKEYIDKLNEICSKDEWYIDLVHTQPFNEVLTISKYRNKLNCKTFLPKHNTVVNCTDKYLNYLLWKKGGLQVPETEIITNYYTVMDMLQKYGKVWIRAPTGAGGKGSLIVTPDSLGFALAWIQYNGGWNKWLVSQYLSPNSVTFMSIWCEGELWVAQCRERLYWEFGSKTLSGVSGVTGACKTVTRSDVIQVGFNAIKAVDSIPHGIFSVDMTYDGSGFPCPTEINIGKFFTTVDFFSRAGLNFPEIYVGLALGEEPEKVGVNPLPDGLLWIRGMDCKPILKSVKEIGC